VTDSSTDSRPVILVTNDDGIESPGLHAVVECLATIGRILVVAPDRNRSGVSRSITLGNTLNVVEGDVPFAEVALATDGTPTDCVRMAVLGLCGPVPDIVVSGSNLGLNVGDDIAYSGTVSAAFDAALNGLPAVAVSQQSLAREMGYPRDAQYDHRGMQRILPGLVSRVLEFRDQLPEGLVVNVNVPGCAPDELTEIEFGVPGRRLYRDKLVLQLEEGGRRTFQLYGDDPEHHADEVGTDIAAIGRGHVAISPLRFNASDTSTAEVMAGWNLGDLLG
jgi:5'-nucleotidase